MQYLLMFVKTYCRFGTSGTVPSYGTLCVLDIEYIYTYIHKDFFIYTIFVYTPKTSLGSHAGLMYMYIYKNIYTQARFIHPDQNEVLESTVKTHLVSIPWGLVLAALIDPTESCVSRDMAVAQSATRSCMASWLCMVVHGVTASCRVKRNRQLHGCSKDTAAVAVCGAAHKGTGKRIGKGTGVILIGVGT